MNTDLVTPHVGVWIETSCFWGYHCQEGVTPHVGVWIETKDFILIKNWVESHLM